MKNEALYHKTVDILVEAYFQNSLEHNNCAACAVGNIIAANMGYEYHHNGNQLYWFGKSVSEAHAWYEILFSSKLNTEGLKQIASTGYSMKEIIAIEEAFENQYSSSDDADKRMFNGLMAVIDVLDVIHEVDNETTISSKNKFIAKC